MKPLDIGFGIACVVGIICIVMMFMGGLSLQLGLLLCGLVLARLL